MDIPEVMKTTVDVDRELAAEAAEILCTKSLKDTVNGALREVVNAELRRQLAEQIRNGTLPVPTEEEYRKLREPKVPIGAARRPGGAPAAPPRVTTVLADTSVWLREGQPTWLHSWRRPSRRTVPR